jgi:hypothetical protein
MSESTLIAYDGKLTPAYPVVSADPNMLWNAPRAFQERGMSAAPRIWLYGVGCLTDPRPSRV